MSHPFPAQADLEVRRCREAARLAREDVALLASRRDAYLALREEERVTGAPRTPPPQFVRRSSARREPPLELQPLEKKKHKKPPPPPNPAPEVTKPARAANPPASKPKITGKAPRDRSASRDRKQRAARAPERTEPERAPEREAALVEPVDLNKLHIHYLCAADETKSISLAVTVPDKWHAKPAAKLVDFFKKQYAAKKGSPPPDDLALRTLGGAPVAGGTVLDALAACKGVLQLA